MPCGLVVNIAFTPVRDVHAHVPTLYSAKIGHTGYFLGTTAGDLDNPANQMNMLCPRFSAAQDLSGATGRYEGQNMLFLGARMGAQQFSPIGRIKFHPEFRVIGRPGIVLDGAPLAVRSPSAPDGKCGRKPTGTRTSPCL